MTLNVGKPTLLVCITPAKKLCRRYEWRIMTHEFELTHDITHEKVEAIRAKPDGNALLVDAQTEPEVA